MMSFASVDDSLVVPLLAGPFADSRGSFAEYFNIAKLGSSAIFASPHVQRIWNSFSVAQVNLAESVNGALRGLHCSPYDKICIVLSGEIFEVVVDLRRDSPRFGTVWHRVVSAQTVAVTVPAGCAHGYLSMGESKLLYLQNGCYDRKNEIEINLLDSTLAIPWPAVSGAGTGTGMGGVSDYVISDKDRANPSFAFVRERLLGAAPRQKILLYGATGYIGAQFKRHLDALVAAGEISLHISTCRIENTLDVVRELDAVHPDAVVIAAGLRGIPNIDWCETHKLETMQINVLAQVSVANECNKRGIHTAVISSGGMYVSELDSSSSSSSSSSAPRTEDDPPNFTAPYYLQMRIVLEKLLEPLQNTLVLRVLYPMSADMHPQSLVTKMLGFAKIFSIPTSVTVLDQMIPLAVHMLRTKVHGRFNFTNPGVVSHDDILRTYQKHVNPQITWNLASPQDWASSHARRGACELDTSKLLAICPPHLRPAPAKEAIVQMCLQIAATSGSSSAAGPLASAAPPATAATTSSSSSTSTSTSSVTASELARVVAPVIQPQLGAIPYYENPAHRSGTTPPPSADAERRAITMGRGPEFHPRVILLTGGAGFIGSHVCRHWVTRYPDVKVVCLDILDYCATLNNITECMNKTNFVFVKGNINNTALVRDILETHKVDTVLHFAAQSHVDLSFGMSLEFTRVNVLGTHSLLECAKNSPHIKRFIFVSTDEVYGEVFNNDHAMESATLDPTNPYSSSKAAAEMITKAYVRSFRLPVIIVRGNNVYGPAQFPEKVIPKFIMRLFRNQKCCIHGTGEQKRTYVYVSDVCEAFDLITRFGIPGEIYNIGTDGSYEVTMLQLARMLVKHIFPNLPNPDTMIEFVEDRKFNDCRYAVGIEKLQSLGWAPQVAFEEGLVRIINWYRTMDKNHWEKYEYSLASHPFLPLHDSQPTTTEHETNAT